MAWYEPISSIRFSPACATPGYLLAGLPKSLKIRVDLQLSRLFEPSHQPELIQYVQQELFCSSSTSCAYSECLCRSDWITGNEQRKRRQFTHSTLISASINLLFCILPTDLVLGMKDIRKISFFFSLNLSKFESLICLSV